MTEQEAIEAIENDLKWHSKELKSKYKEALNMAIKALEKQIAKKPTDVRYFGEAGHYIGLCPVCGQGNNSDYPYCGDCGQKLDWSEV